MKLEFLLSQLEQRFGAEYEYSQASENEEEYEFLKLRDEFEEIYSWNFDVFVEHYQLIKDYGLEEKMLDVLAFRIEHFMGQEELVELKQTEFFRRFGNHESISCVINNKSE